MQNIILFDYDGTLHETMRIYKPAIAEVVHWLREDCGVAVEQPSDARISSWLGMNTADMWRDFMPELDDALKQKAGRRVGDHMLANLQRGMGAWYPGTEQMLDRLCDAGYTLAVLSNCGNSYAQAHWDAFGMDRWFTAFFACETWNGAPKSEIVKDLSADFSGALERSPVKRQDAKGTFSHSECGTVRPREELRISEQENQRSGAADGIPFQIRAVVGDRDSDLSGAQAIGVPFIGCLYGYGSRAELAGSSAFVTVPEEIPEHFNL